MLFYFELQLLLTKATKSKHTQPSLPQANDLHFRRLTRRSVEKSLVVLMPHSQDLLARDLLELATSFLGARRLRQEKSLAFRKSFAGSHSNLNSNPIRYYLNKGADEENFDGTGESAFFDLLMIEKFGLFNYKRNN